jgi:hypothetical protein
VACNWAPVEIPCRFANAGTHGVYESMALSSCAKSMNLAHKCIHIQTNTCA